jgi:hypothetical protein
MATALRAVINASKTATPKQKYDALQDVSENELDFKNMNEAVQRFLATAGDVNPERIIEIGEEVWFVYKKKKDGDK